MSATKLPVISLLQRIKSIIWSGNAPYLLAVVWQMMRQYNLWWGAEELKWILWRKSSVVRLPAASPNAFLCSTEYSAAPHEYALSAIFSTLQHFRQLLILIVVPIAVSFAFHCLSWKVKYSLLRYSSPAKSTTCWTCYVLLFASLPHSFWTWYIIPLKWVPLCYNLELFHLIIYAIVTS